MSKQRPPRLRRYVKRIHTNRGIKTSSAFSGTVLSRGLTRNEHRIKRDKEDKRIVKGKRKRERERDIPSTIISLRDWIESKNELLLLLWLLIISCSQIGKYTENSIANSISLKHEEKTANYHPSFPTKSKWTTSIPDPWIDICVEWLLFAFDREEAFLRRSSTIDTTRWNASRILLA